MLFPTDPLVWIQPAPEAYPDVRPDPRVDARLPPRLPPWLRKGHTNFPALHDLKVEVAEAEPPHRL